MALKNTYTYDDFETAANRAGLLGSFSQQDLALAQQHPDAGMSILSTKKDWLEAQTDEARAMANAAANAIRSSYGGYTANSAGKGYYADPMLSRQIRGQLDAMGAQEPFKYENNVQYQAALKGLTERQPFAYDAAADPLYGQYRKTYLREGDRATANALAQAAAATGGRPSSYAATAASQAGDYYASQLADKIPELYQQAYQRYLSEQQLRQAAYQALAADRGQAMTEYQAELARQQALLSALQGQDATDYARQQDILDRNRQAEQDRIALEQAEWTRARQEEQDRLAQEQQAWENAYKERGYTDAQAQQDWQNRFELAQAAAALGDYSGLRELGIEPNMQTVLAAALASAGRAVPIGYGSSGGGSSGGGSSAGGVSAEDAAAIRAAYPDGNIGAEEWQNLLQYYSAEELAAAGFRLAQGQTADQGQAAALNGKSVDQASVTALGMGPLSEAQLSALVDAGTVEMYTEGNKIKFRRVGTAGGSGRTLQTAQAGQQTGQAGSWLSKFRDALLSKR